MKARSQVPQDNRSVTSGFMLFFLQVHRISTHSLIFPTLCCLLSPFTHFLPFFLPSVLLASLAALLTRRASSHASRPTQLGSQTLLIAFPAYIGGGAEGYCGCRSLFRLPPPPPHTRTSPSTTPQQHISVS